MIVIGIYSFMKREKNCTDIEQQFVNHRKVGIRKASQDYRLS